MIEKTIISARKAQMAYSQSLHELADSVHSMPAIYDEAWDLFEELLEDATKTAALLAELKQTFEDLPRQGSLFRPGTEDDDEEQPLLPYPETA